MSVSVTYDGHLRQKLLFFVIKLAHFLEILAYIFQ